MYSCRPTSTLNLKSKIRKAKQQIASNAKIEDDKKMERARQQSTRTKKRPEAVFNTTTWILIVLCASFSSFYLGVYAGITASSSSDKTTCNKVTIEDDKELQRKVEALADQKMKLLSSPSRLQELCNNHLCNRHDSSNTKPKRSSSSNSQLFPKSLTQFANGLVRVSKDDIMKTFDFGVPPNPRSEGKDALILYNTAKALPNDKQLAAAANLKNGHTALPFTNASIATENCDALNVVLTDIPGGLRQCFALIGGQYQSYHIQRWLRRADDHGGVNKEESLKLSSRGWTGGGRQEYPPPVQRHVSKHQESLRTYLNNVESIKSRLNSILKSMNSNQIVVMTCNHGQSELLMNFVCNARAKGFDLTNVIVFPTDIETKELVEGLGLKTFYEETLMASIPKKEAGVYGDTTFTQVMFAKILCVQLVNELSYDLLFMDVDLVWYRNPLDYFNDKSLPKFDVYFQDDGSRQERYAPYSANSGFYFVRSNDRTKHLFRHLLYSGDLLNAWYSHQQVLTVLLSEYSSLLGLTVKVFAKERYEFPGGWLFHRKPELVRSILEGKSKNYIFHMSWTENKKNKVKFFQQMGQWYVQESCIGETLSSLQFPASQCCTAEQLIKCHYRDKPSSIPCKDSPLIDPKKGQSFW